MRPTRWIIPLALFGLEAAARGDERKLDVDEIPKAVARAARKAFPEANIVGASVEDDEGESLFEVELKLDGKSIELLIDDEGEIEATEKEIEVEDLPRAVLKVARAKFPGAKITRVEEVTDEDDVVVYELTISVDGKKPFEVVISPGGKIFELEDEEEVDDAKPGPRGADPKDEPQG